jgi:Tol biopolymer transport system component
MHRLPAALFLATALVACHGDDPTPLVVTDDEATTAEDTAVEIDVLANDTGGDELHILRASVEGDGGTLEVLDGQRLRFTPTANFHGEATITYRANDTVASANGRVRVTVTAVNDAPAATAASIATGRNEAKAVRLAGTDLDGDALAFEVVTQPTHGTLSGTAPDLTYTPATGYSGADSFTFRAKDASATSEPATISITVAESGSPVATAQEVDAVEETPRSITLAGTDPDGDPLAFTVVSQPEHGTLSGTAPNLTYTPAANYTGPDSFRFTVSDGALESAPAWINIDVENVNDRPVATGQTITIDEDTDHDLVLTGVDPDDSDPQFDIVTPPAHGEIIQTGFDRRYQPRSHYNGTDSFTFTMTDGELTSEPATVTIHITPIPDRPVAVAQPTVNVTEDVAKEITLLGLDPDGDAVTLAIVTQPAHGTLSGDLPNLTYTPAANYNGSDSFVWTASDGTLTSPPRTVTIAVAAVDDPPVVPSFSGTVTEDTSTTIPLPATDADGETLTYTFTHASLPTGATITGAGSAWQLVMCCNFSYPTTFGFQVTARDGHSASAPAQYSYTIIAQNDPPQAKDDNAIAMPGQPVTIDVLRNDREVDGDATSIASVTAPAHGEVEIVDDELVYTPASGNTAQVTMTYTVEDETGLADTATVTVGIGAFPSGLPTRHVGDVAPVADLWNQYRPHDVSSDGRYTALLTSSNLAGNDHNGLRDVYVYDAVADTYELVSISTAGALTDGYSEAPSISDDGRFVAFASSATTLVPGDTNGAVDVFVRDRLNRTTVRVSVGPAGEQVSGASRDPDLSADGSVVVFISSAFQLVADDANGAIDVFARDLVAGVTTRVSVPTGGGEADQLSVQPVVSGDGRVVAFTSTASNLVVGDTNAAADIFVHDRTTGVTERASVASTGTEANSASDGAVLSATGRFVAFRSHADNLVSGGSAGGTFVRDRQAETTTYAGDYTLGISISGDGRYLAGSIWNGSGIVVDRFAGVAHVFTGAQGHDTSNPVISRNGRYVLFISNQSPINPAAVSSGRLWMYANPL